MSLLKRISGLRPSGKQGERVYAIGDVHGCLDRLKSLLQTLKTDHDYRDEAKTYLVFLGDLIDRGPDSKGVVELAMDLPYTFAEPLFIMGNHEEMLVRGLTGEPHLLRNWLIYGGYACAESYDIPRKNLVGQEPEILEYQLRAAIPRKHVEFLSSFLDYIQFGDYLFTHAGIRPEVPLERQESKDLRWIREPFLSYRGDHGVMVVHGHTISDDIEVKHNRIGLDTGAYKTGRLSAVCIENQQLSYFSI